MEAFQSAWSFFLEHVFPHWPGIAFSVFVAVVAQTLKFRVLTKEFAVKYRLVFWARRVFPILLLLLGILPGTTWPGEVVAGIDTVTEKVWYFMGCAGLSILGFNVFKQWVKKKYDLDVGLDSIVPKE